MARCARASSIRSTAVRRSRFELAARSISELSIASSKLRHQALKSADCSVILLICTAVGEDGCGSRVIGAAVARADQCGGVGGVGRAKFGPTVHAPSSSAIQMTLKTGRRVAVGTLFMMIIACGG